MFKQLRIKFHDMATITTLCNVAEQYALKRNEEIPGAEHFLLAALDLEEGSAKRVFKNLGVNPDEFNLAISNQYADALASLGITMIATENVVNKAAQKPNSILYETKASAQDLMQSLAKRKDKNIPLQGVHVLEVICTMQEGVAIRALKAINVDLSDLQQAVLTELNAKEIEEVS